MQGGADRGCGERQTQQSTGEAEQQTFQYRFAEDDAGARAEGQADGVLAAPADGADQQQTRDIDTGNQQDDGDGEEQNVQQGADVGDGVFTE